MNRLTTSAFAMLVAATIAAFFITQHLKVTTPLIQGFPAPVPAAIDPLHGVPCAGRNSASTKISFYLQHRADTVDVYVVDDEDGTIVRTVASGRHMRRDVRNPDGVFHWNGREDNGQVAPDGTYYFRVALIHQGRTVDLDASNQLVKVKTVPPHPVVTSVTPSLIPGSDGTRVTIRYKGNENRGGTVRIYRTDLPGRPPAGQELPDAVEGPAGDLGREDRRAPRAGGHVPGRARRDRRRVRHRPLPGAPSAGAGNHRARYRHDPAQAPLMNLIWEVVSS